MDVSMHLSWQIYENDFSLFDWFVHQKIATFSAIFFQLLTLVKTLGFPKKLLNFLRSAKFNKELLVESLLNLTYGKKPSYAADI